MKYKLIIFDFDGTLADSFPWLVSVTDQLADQYKFKRPDKSQIEAMRSYSAQKLIRDYRIPFWRVPRIGKQVRQMMADNIQHIRMFEGVPYLLQTLAHQGAILAMLSSNSYQNIQQVLGPENIALIQYFECGVSIFGKSAKIKKILKKSGLQPGDAILIGDEIRDLEAARAIPIASGAVAWGYAKVEALQTHSPNELFNNMGEIIEKIGD